MAALPADLDRWMTSRQACERLGVRPQTLYAYVSRGLLRSVRHEGRSRYDPVQVDALARRTARGRRPGRFEVTVDTEVTRMTKEGGLWYRGVAIEDLVGVWSFERTAAWLWTGVDGGEPERPWAVDPDRLARARGALGGLGLDAAPGTHLRVAVAALGPTAAAPGALGPAAGPGQSAVPAPAVGAGPRGVSDGRGPAVARATIATLVEALPLVGPTPRRDASLAARLWPRVSVRRPRPVDVVALDAVLVALADHELATSTLAVRVATSTGADLDAALLAGLATLSGPLHGAAAEPVRRMLADARRRGAPAAVEAAAEGRRGPPGTGHAVYETVDPRTELVLAALRPAVDPVRWSVLEAVRAELERRGAMPVNVDLALGAVLDGCDLVDGAAEVVFAVARTAGWVAHAREEARHRLRYRARAVYTGPR